MPSLPSLFRVSKRNERPIFPQVHSSIYNGMFRFHRSIQADQQQNPLFQRQHTRFYNHKQFYECTQDDWDHHYRQL